MEYILRLEDIRRGTPVEDVVGLDLDLEEASRRYLEDLESRNVRAQTRQYYHDKHRILIAVLGPKVPLSKIFRPQVTGFIERRRKEGVSAGTIKKALTALRTLQRHFEIEPAWSMPRHLLQHKPKRRRVMPLSDVARLWQVIDGPPKVAVGLCLLIGIRAEEAYRADASWCDFEAGEFYLPEEGTKRDEPNRTALVKTIMEILPREGPLVRMERYALGRYLKRECKSLELPVIAEGPGLFRHICATTLGEFGYGDSEIALVLSHAYGTMRDRYVHSQAINKKRAMLEAVEAEFKKALAAIARPNPVEEVWVLAPPPGVQEPPKGSIS